MSTVRVSTWDEFLAAVGNAGDEIILDADLNANGWTPVEIGVSVHSIDGTGHSISNIAYNTNMNCFYANHPCEFKNVKFLNVNVTSTADTAFFHGRNARFTFTNCQFQGRFYNFGYRSLTFNQCTFAFEDNLNYMFWSDSPIYCTECYIDFKTQNFNNDFIIASIQSSTMTDCYFKGDIKVNNANGCTSITMYNCVWNVDCTAKTTLLNFKPFYFDPSGISLVNSTKIHDMVVKPQTNVAYLSDSEISYPEGLTAIPATGFPLVV
jgi:hypothetical protein